ncbi:DUF3329 domain-containing protein [Tropicimonas sp.]|uniref:DUF3329 domain-containing protein n=1 Tax=Tropicimonas sp. TaxID=2067044 RepID=UPI003A83B212
MRRPLLDLQQEFYRPLWIRVTIVVLCLGWGAVEFISGAPFWGVVFGGIGLFAAHQFFIAFDPEKPDEPENDEEKQ